MSSPDKISKLLHSMQSCISDVKTWATVNMTMLCDNKTQLMLVVSKRTKHLHNLPTSITIGSAQIPFKQSVKNLGFTLDCHLIMNAHVTNIPDKYCNCHTCICFYFVLLLFCFDYCNSLLFGSTRDVTSHLQRIQNQSINQVYFQINIKKWRLM